MSFEINREKASILFSTVSIFTSFLFPQNVIAQDNPSTNRRIVCDEVTLTLPGEEINPENGVIIAVTEDMIVVQGTQCIEVDSGAGDEGQPNPLPSEEELLSI